MKKLPWWFVAVVIVLLALIVSAVLALSFEGYIRTAGGVVRVSTIPPPPPFDVPCHFNALSVTWDCSDQTNYSGYTVLNVTWLYDSQVIAYTGANAHVSFRAPGQNWFSDAPNHTVSLQVWTPNGQYNFVEAVTSSELIAWLFIAAVVFAVFFTAWRIDASSQDQDTYFVPVHNPSYRETAISVDEYPAGWRSYRQNDPKRYTRIRSETAAERKKHPDLWFIYGVRPASEAERQRTGKRYVAEVQTVRERIR